MESYTGNFKEIEQDIKKDLSKDFELQYSLSCMTTKIQYYTGAELNRMNASEKKYFADVIFDDNIKYKTWWYCPGWNEAPNHIMYIEESSDAEEQDYKDKDKKIGDQISKLCAEMQTLKAAEKKPKL